MDAPLPRTWLRVLFVLLLKHVVVANAMLLPRAWRSEFVRMSSTLVGRSGRLYVRDKALRAHPKESQLNVYVAQ